MQDGLAQGKASSLSLLDSSNAETPDNLLPYDVQQATRQMDWGKPQDNASQGKRTGIGEAGRLP